MRNTNRALQSGGLHPSSDCTGSPGRMRVPPCRGRSQHMMKTRPSVTPHPAPRLAAMMANRNGGSSRTNSHRVRHSPKLPEKSFPLG